MARWRHVPRRSLISTSSLHSSPFYFIVIFFCFYHDILYQCSFHHGHTSAFSNYESYDFASYSRVILSDSSVPPLPSLFQTQRLGASAIFNKGRSTHCGVCAPCASLVRFQLLICSLLWFSGEPRGQIGHTCKQHIQTHYIIDDCLQLGT